LDHPWSWFPAQTEPQSRFFPGASFRADRRRDGYNDITPRMGAAYDLFGNGKNRAQGESREVPAGRQRQQPRIYRQSGAADSGRGRRDFSPVDQPLVDGPQRQLHSGLQPE